jgi:hypothetical protein
MIFSFSSAAMDGAAAARPAISTAERTQERDATDKDSISTPQEKVRMLTKADVLISNYMPLICALRLRREYKKIIKNQCFSHSRLGLPRWRLLTRR